MTTKRRASSCDTKVLQDRAEFLREIRLDLRDARCLQRALDRRVGEAHDASYANLGAGVRRYVEDLERTVASWVAWERGPRKPGDAVTVGVGTGRVFSRQRFRLRELLVTLPLDLFTGLETPEPLRSVAEDPVGNPRRPGPPASDLETALLRLPTPRLRTIRTRHGIWGHRARDRIAAAVADAVHRPRRFRESLRALMGPDHLRALGRLVAAGRVPVAALAPGEQADFAVPRTWTYTAPGIGGSLRQLGLVFVAAGPNGLEVYVPEDARAPVSLALRPILRQLGTPADQTAAEALAMVAEPARARRRRERAACAGLLYVPPELPTRLARLRRRTPGPDRVADVEVRGEDPANPVTRRIRISYQRTVGALREAIQLALVHPVGNGRIFVPPSTGRPFCVWLDPRARERGQNVRDEWATTIRDAFASEGAALRYYGPPETEGTYALRLVSLHVPERLGPEPRIVWGEGIPARPAWPTDLPRLCAPHLEPYRREPAELRPEQLQAALDAANCLLERI